MAVPFLTAPNLEKIQHLIHGFSTRAGGVSEGCYESLNLGWETGDEDEVVEENYARLAQTVGVERTQIVGVLQNHAAEVAVVHSTQEMAALATTKADALITNVSGICFTVRVADCLPIILVDPNRHAVGLVHAGWRGTLAKVLPVTIQQMMKEYKTDPSSLLMAVGAGIGICCFEISFGIAALFEQECSLTQGEMKEKGKPHLDLAAINLRLAREAGIRAENVWKSGLCTKCDPKRFFSYRRDGRESGRSIGIVGWTA